MKEEVLKLKLKDIGLPNGLYENIRSRLRHFATEWDKAFTVQDLIDAGIYEITRTRNFGPKSLETVLAKMQELGVPFTLSATEFESWDKWSKTQFGEVLKQFGAIVEPSEQLEMVSLDSLHQSLPEKMDVDDFDLSVLAKFGMVALKTLPANNFAVGSASMKKIQGLKLQYIQMLAQEMAEITPKNYPNKPAYVLDKELQQRCDRMYDEQCAYATIVSEKRGELAKPLEKASTKSDGKGF